MKAFAFDETKFRELLLYVADRCEHDPNCGATKLNKILFLADFEAYAELGMPITGAEYSAIQFGPAPKTLPAIRDDMERKGELAVKRRSHFGRNQSRIVALRKADLSAFSGEEVALVESVIRDVADMNAAELTEFTHRMPGWQAASQWGGVIPYQTAFLSRNQEATQEDIARANQLADEHDW